MTAEPAAPDAAWATRVALARVLDLDAGALRADSPLDDLGADSVARIAFADVVEELLAERGVVVTVDDVPLREAVVVGDLTAAVLAAAGSGSAAGATS